MKLKEKLAKLSNYAILGSFLAIEVFAFIIFSFGNSFLFFGILSLVLLLLLALLSFNELKVDGFMSSIKLFFPLMLFVLLTALSNYSVGHLRINDFNIGQLIFIPLGLLSIALCGNILAKNKTFKLSTFVLVMFSALALLVFINLLINLINFGWFYSLKYKGYYMYYGGKRSEVEVSQLAYALEGFQFIEVKMSHYAMYPAMLLTSGIALIYTKYKENKTIFLTYVGFIVLGILALLFVPSLIGLVFAIAVGLIILIIYLYNKFEIGRHKWPKIIMYVGLALALIVVLVMILNKNVPSVANAISKSSLLNKLLNTNRIVRRYNEGIRDIFTSQRIFGFCAEQITPWDTIEIHLTGSAFFDSFMTSGFIGVIMLVSLFFFGFKGFAKNKYLEMKEKRYFLALLAFVIFFAFMCLFFYEGEYGIFHQIYSPIYMTGPFMIVVLILFYMNARGTNSNGGRL
ncbi:MAG: hypothetical protein MJ225_00850 [Bacilli bacterium]|nr:hypothetical protein [Bacilli bacterium]